MISRLASDGLRLGSASAKLAQPSGESPNPCKNIIAALSFDEFDVALLFAPGITSSVFALWNMGTVRGEINLPSLFVEKAVTIIDHSTMVKRTIAADNMAPSGSSDESVLR